LQGILRQACRRSTVFLVEGSFSQDREHGISRGNRAREELQVRETASGGARSFIKASDARKQVT
jgi:hypothetical protein